jgi:hypothetical protein
MKLFSTAHLTRAHIAEHAKLVDAQIKKLDRRGAHITPPERALSLELKKLRLVLKDRIDELERVSARPQLAYA